MKADLPSFLNGIPESEIARHKVSRSALKPMHSDVEVWVVEKGAVHIWIQLGAIQQSGWGRAQHPPWYINEVSQGSTIFPFPLRLFTRRRKAFVKATEDARLVAVPFSLLSERLKAQPKLWDEFNEAVGEWMHLLLHRVHLCSEQVHAVWDHVQDGPTTLVDKHREEVQSWFDLAGKGTVHLKKGAELYSGVHRAGSANPAHWLGMKSGVLRCCGFDQSELKKEPYVYPLAFPAYYEAREACDVEIYRHPSDPALVVNGLGHFAELYIKLLKRTVGMETRRTKEEVVQQVQRDRFVVDDSMRHIGEVLEPEEFLIASNPNEALSATLELISERLGTTFTIPRDLNRQPTLDDKLQHLAWRSEVRYRKIVLEADWMEKVYTPILAFYKESEQPVMVATDSCDTLYLYDPVAGVRRRMNEVVAKELEPFAFTFYHEIPEEKKDSFSRIIKHFALAPGRRSLWYKLIAHSLLAILLSSAIPVLIQVIFDYAIGNRDIALLTQIYAMGVVLIVSSGCIVFARQLTAMRMQGLLAHDLTCAVWSRLLRLPAKFFRNIPAGDVMSRLTAADEMVSHLGNLVPNFLSAAGLFIFPFIMMYYSTALGLMVLAIAIPTIFMAYIIFRRIATLVIRELKLEAGLHSFAVEGILGISKIRITSSESRIFSQWAASYSKIRGIAYTVLKHDMLLKILGSGMPIVTGSVALLMLSSFPSIGEGLSFGGLTGFLAASTLFWRDAGKILTAGLELARLITPWQRLQPLLGAKQEVHADHLCPPLQGAIEFQEVEFTYSVAQVPILSGLSFSASPGDLVAILGKSGCGKTTIIRLLTGFEEPSNGKVLVDGINLHEMNLQSVRSQMGVVMQDASLTVSSIRDFLRMGGAQSDEEMWWALEFANMREEVEHLAMGLETLISDQDGVFSDGQRQRLLIARALIGHPRILIFDEAMSALDDASQARIVELLESLSITRVVVTHRLSSIKKADKILVVEEGKVIQEGTYQELVSVEGPLRDLAAE